MRSFVVILLVAFVACGGEDRPEGDCIPGSSTRYLPYVQGNSWTYEVTDLVLQETTTKSQSVTGTMDHPDDGMPVFVQVTTKSSGKTESWVRLSGESLVRLQQVDYDADSVLERTTVYEPGKIRLDETESRVASGTSFAEDYTSIIYDEFGAEKSRADVTEQWQVLSVGDACPGEDFADYDCLEIERARTGTPSKTFWFARGIGKVREEGGQIEQLTACALE